MGNIPHPWAGGGIVTSSHLGLVGEAGPRGHHPVDQPGAAQLMAMSGLDKLGGGGGGANTYNITMNAPLTAQTNADANMIGDEIVWALAPLLALV